MRAARRALFLLLGLHVAAAVRAGPGRWTNHGLPGVPILSVRADPVDPAVVYAAGRTGTYRSADGAVTWTRILGPAAALAIDPSQPATLYVGGADLARSLDGGRTWLPPAGVGCPFVTALAIDPEDPATLFAGTSDLVNEPARCGGLFRSRDFGGTWSEVLPVHVAHGGLALDSRSPAKIFAIEFDELGNSLHRSDDRGSRWVSASVGLPSPLAVAPDPWIGNRVYAAAIDGVYVSRDAGETWQRSGLDDIIVTALARDPRDPDLVYAGTLARGIYRSLDGGRSWNAFNDGLTDLSVSSLSINASGTRIFAGTNTDGVFDFEFVARAPVLSGPDRPATRPLEPRP